MIRVLHIVTTLDRGGIETMLMNYYRHIDRSMVQFDFLKHVPYECDYEDEARKMGARIYSVPKLNPFSFTYRNALDQFFSNHPEYKIIHSHLDCMSSLPLYYAKKNNVEIRIAHSHNTNQEINLKLFLKKFYKKRIPKEANVLLACGKDAGKWMYGSHEFKVLHNAIEIEKFIFDQEKRDTLRESLGITNEFVLGHVGRFFKQKNHKKLIDIFSEVARIEKNSKLLLIGTGPLEEEIRLYAKKKNLSEKVIFYGASDKVNELLWAMDVFVFPSLYEGLPVTLIEAQASGVRCVVSDKITREIKVTDNILYYGLNESNEAWAKRIVSFGKKYERRNMLCDLKGREYDIFKSSIDIQKYYLKISGNKMITC